MESEGMVAVVRGLKDAGLAVTLVESGRQYTLLPDAVPHPDVAQVNFNNPEAYQYAGHQATPQYQSGAQYGGHQGGSQFANNQSACQYAGNQAAYQYATNRDVSTRRESGVQATDGRYASTYRMMHCHMTPTSPPELVTEFPPQKAELCPGRENFQIGSHGSGETYCQATRCNSFRGGMSWPDRGSVCSPKPSVQQDSFTNSLRKYPNLSQDRSSEIVERLISFTQAKHSANKQRSNASPTRNIIDSDMSNQTITIDASSRSVNGPKYPRHYEPEAVRNKRLEESPTRERSRRGPVDQDTLDSWRRSTFSKTNDVRFLRDVSRKVRDGIRTLSHQSNNQPEKLSNTRERCEPSMMDKGLEAQSNTNSVNMEIQAAVQMVSREVVTVPLAVPSKRTIAVPLTPSPSRAEPNSEDVSKLSSEMTMTLQSRNDDQESSTIEPRRELHPAISDIQLSDNRLKLYKGSKSHDEIRMIQNEILVIQDLHLSPCYSKFHRKSHCRINKSNKFLIKLPRNNRSLPKHDSKLYEHKCSQLTNSSKELQRFQSYTRIFHAEITPFRISDEEDLTEILDDWLDLIPIKQEESYGRKYDKEFIFYEFIDCLKYYASNPFEANRKYKLKSDIINRLDTLPIDVKGNRGIVLSRLADILINKVKHIDRRKTTRSTNGKRREIKDICSRESDGHALATESELKIFISSELIIYFEKTHLKMNRLKIKDLEDVLLHCIMISMEDLRFNTDKRVRKSVVKILRDFGFSEYQATHFSNLLITHLKESFIKDALPSSVRSETLIVLPNIQKLERFRKSFAHNSKVSIVSNKHENSNDLESETNELCRQIDEWLSSLKLEILESRENGLKQVIINDLAGDIIDRHKYLELNPTSRGSDEAELEHLRYQIFKWIGKLVGEDNLVPQDHAPELMMRIQGLPMFSNSHNKLSSCHAIHNGNDAGKRPLISGNSRSDINIKKNRSSPRIQHGLDNDKQNKNEKVPLSVSVSTSSRDFNIMTMSHVESSKLAYSESNNKIRCNQNSKTACCANNINQSSQSVKSVEQLEAEYQRFVKDWVQQVPIKTAGPDHEAVVERARVELHNGLWKIVSKLNCDPATYYNRFFYEDLLDDAIEELFDCLPQTPEMISVRNSLKAKFIEKTVHIYDQIRANEDASFKNKLVKNVVSNLRTHGIIDHEHEESIKQHEDLQIIKLVEEYLLYTRFKNDNKLISDVFKKKLSHEIGDFVEDLKKNHDRELRNVDSSSYKKEIMNALEKVPLPCERTMKEEADDVLLGIEVEQWYTDLPIGPNEDSINAFHRKRQLDMLTMRIKEIENNTSAHDPEPDLRNEITRFLEKIPLKEGERLNTKFMVDELVNRVKNMQKQDTSQNTKRVVFQPPDTYDEFGKNIPFASSYIETSPSYQNPVIETDITNNRFNQTSKCDKSCGAQPLSSNGHDLNNITERSHDGTRSYIKEPSSYRRFAEQIPTCSSFNESADQWYTSQDIQTHQPRQSIANDTQHHTIPTSSYAPQEYYHQDRSPNKSMNQNYHPNINYQRGETLQKTQRQLSFIDRDPRINSFEDPSSNQYNSPGIRTSKGILGISQVAGLGLGYPLGYRTSQFESPQFYHPSPGQGPNVPTYSTDDHRGSVTKQTGIAFKQNPEDREIDQSNKCSIGCQSRNDAFGRPIGNLENQTNRMFDITKRLSIATNTSTGHLPDSRKPSDESPPRQPTEPKLNKRRPKWSISEKEGVKRGSYETDDDDEDYHCRCIERYWKCRRRPKYLSSEEYDDYPPCFPMLFPYPCFL